MKAIEFINISDLAAWLDARHITRDEWGQGEAKTIADLWSEYRSGETTFEDDPPLRRVAVVQLRLRRGDRVLVELEQKLVDGRRRARHRLPSEKMKAGESPHDAARRCLQEELGLAAGEAAIAVEPETTETVLDSPSYPGLPTRYVLHLIDIETDALPDGDFWRENAATGDPVRRHRFGWRPLAQ